jgi:hypothetical protein
MRTRVWIRQGRLSEALGWVRERGLSADDDLSYLREFEHITLARVLLAQYAAERGGRFLDEASGFLERLLQAAEEGEERAASSKSWGCRRLPHRREATARLRLHHCNARWR